MNGRISGLPYQVTSAITNSETGFASEQFWAFDELYTRYLQLLFVVDLTDSYHY